VHRREITGRDTATARGRVIVNTTAVLQLVTKESARFWFAKYSILPLNDRFLIVANRAGLAIRVGWIGRVGARRAHVATSASLFRTERVVTTWDARIALAAALKFSRAAFGADTSRFYKSTGLALFAL
jgi:hypothetical protein